MKTEDFDDAIRNKLQDVNANASEKELAAVHEFVLAAQQGRARKRLLGFAITTGIVLLLGTLLTWNIFQKNEIARLRSEIRHLEKEKTDVLIAEEPVEITASTVAVAKMARGSRAEQPGVTKNLIPSSLATQEAKSKIEVPEAKNHLITSSPDQTVLLADNNAAVSNPASKVRVTASDHEGTSDQKQIEDPAGNVALTQASSTETPAMTALTPVENLEGQVVGDLFPRDSLAQNKVNELQEPEDAAETMVSTYTNPWKYQAGAEMLVGHEQWGPSIFAEAVLKNHVVFSAGLRMLKDGVENFETREDYDEHKSEHFKEVYGNHVEEGSHDFRIKNTIYQLPVLVSYRFNLKNNFSLLMGLGTDIDFFTCQKIAYHHPRPNAPSDLQTQHLHTLYKPVYFNNYVASIAIQKQFNHFGCQLMPYVGQQLVKVDYKKEMFNFGLRVRLFYTF